MLAILLFILGAVVVLTVFYFYDAWAEFKKHDDW